MAAKSSNVGAILGLIGATILLVIGLAIGGVLLFSGVFFMQEPQIGWVNTVVSYGWEFITSTLAAAGLSWKK